MKVKIKSEKNRNFSIKSYVVDVSNTHPKHDFMEK